MEHLIRTELLLGPEAMKRLASARVAVFGLGGVGGYCAEALIRSGIGALDLVDGDGVAESNLNRQILATRRTIGQNKAEAAAARAADIDPSIRVRAFPLYFLPETEDRFDFQEYDFVVDAVDMVSAKLRLAEICSLHGVPLISCMGAGNKLDPSRFRVSDISETTVCPLARVMRRELKKRGIPHLPVVWSDDAGQHSFRPRRGGADPGRIRREGADPRPDSGNGIAGMVPASGFQRILR